MCHKTTKNFQNYHAMVSGNTFVRKITKNKNIILLCHVGVHLTGRVYFIFLKSIQSPLFCLHISIVKVSCRAVSF